MPGHRNHSIAAALGGGLIVGLIHYSSQYIEYYNPGIRETFILMGCAIIGGLIIDIEQRFSVSATGLYVGIFMSIEACLINNFYRYLGQYINNVKEAFAVIIIITAVSFVISGSIFELFQRLIPHKKFHQVVLSIVLIGVLSVGFAVQNTIGPKPSMAKWVVRAFVFVYGNLIHLAMDDLL